MDKVAAIAQLNQQKTNKRKLKHSALEDKLLYGLTNFVLTFVLIVVAYPMIYVVSASFSSPDAVSSGQVYLWPVDFSLIGYRIVFSYRNVWVGFANSVFYTITSTSFSMFMSVLLAYPLSRKTYQGRKVALKILAISMMVGAGLIPHYILMSNLHLTNTRLGIIINGCLSIYNAMIIRSYFQTNIPVELIEAARLDGCSELRALFRIVLPLSKAVLAVVCLYYAVGVWNNYFEAMIYLRDPDKYPLQVFLRDILTASNVDITQVEDVELAMEMASAAEVMKYALIIITSVPVVSAYPFVQKFFEKGVMIGSVKG